LPAAATAAASCYPSYPLSTRPCCVCGSQLQSFSSSKPYTVVTVTITITIQTPVTLNYTLCPTRTCLSRTQLLAWSFTSPATLLLLLLHWLLLLVSLATLAAKPELI
jgi:hypothetical protein